MTISKLNQPQFDPFKIEKVLYTDMWTQKNCNHFIIKHINFNKHKNACTEITNSIQVLTIFPLYLVQQSVSVPPPESGLALSNQHLYSEGRLYHLHRVQALVRDEENKVHNFTRYLLVLQPNLSKNLSIIQRNFLWTVHSQLFPFYLNI